MPPLETDDRYQPAVLWLASGIDRYGNKTFSDDIEIMVRQEKGKKATTPAGDMITFDAIVVVDRVIAPDSLMFLGTLTEFHGIGTDTDQAEIMEVVENFQVPDLKGRSMRRTVGLNRFRGTLPDSL